MNEAEILLTGLGQRLLCTSLKRRPAKQTPSDSHVVLG